MTFVFGLDQGIAAYWRCEETNTYVIAKENVEGCISVQFVP